MYIHQNPNNANLSRLVNDFKKETIINSQTRKINAQKKRLAELKKSMIDGESVLDTTLNILKQAGQQISKELSIVGFKGVFKKGEVSLSPKELQARIDKEVNSLQQYAQKIKNFLENKTLQGTIFSEQDIIILNSLQQQTEEAIKKLSSNIPQDQYKDVLGQITGVASNIIGTLTEQAQAEIIQSLFQDSKIKAHIKLTGSQKGSSYRTKTSDYQITFEGVNLQDFQLGVSVKRTRQSPNAKSVLAKVKTTTLESLLNASGVKIHRESLYNVFANHGRVYYDFNDSDGRGQPIPVKKWEYEGFEELIQNLHRAFILTSLAGDLTKADFASYLVINDKVYSILDLVDSFFKNGKASGISILSNIKSNQTKIAMSHSDLVKASINSNNYIRAGKTRSASVERLISSMSVIVQARISLSTAI